MKLGAAQNTPIAVRTQTPKPTVSAPALQLAPDRFTPSYHDQVQSEYRLVAGSMLAGTAIGAAAGYGVASSGIIPVPPQTLAVFGGVTGAVAGLVTGYVATYFQ